MLRTLVGDSAFFQGVRAYYVAHRHGNAVTDDLRLAVERTSGMQLGWFFDQWLRRPGFAELTASWRWNEATSDVVVTVEQGTRFAPYRLLVEVEIRQPDGSARVLPLEIPAQSRTEIPIRLGGSAPPSAVVFDPRVQVLAKIVTR
jgi:aminopeptidase N